MAMNLDKKLFIGILLNVVFTIIEMNIGYFSKSLSLIADAFCNLTDVISLIISFFALKLSCKKADSKRTFGYGRINVLAGLFNILILLAVIIGIMYQAYYKFFNPEPIEGITVMIVGFIGIIVNGIVALSLFKDNDNLMIRTALFNLILDVLASLGALVSGIIITLTNQTFIDPLISIIIVLALLGKVLGVLRETINILLESVPKNLNLEVIENAIQEYIMVKKIDNLRVWSIGSNQPAMTAILYLEVDDLSSINDLLQQIKNTLKQRFNFCHITLETQIRPNKINQSVT